MTPLGSRFRFKKWGKGNGRKELAKKLKNATHE
jgi:hypothetical protein